MGTLNNFIVEPFLPHAQNTEAYICITSARAGDTILFSPTGGVDVGDVDAHALRLNIPTLPSASNPFPTRDEVQKTLLASYASGKRKEALTDFITRLYSVYVDLHFAYLEINPLVVLDDGSIHYLDMAAKLDQTAEFICGPKWSIARDPGFYNPTGAHQSDNKIGADRGPPMVWPAPFGRDLTKEEGLLFSGDQLECISCMLHSIHPETRRVHRRFPQTHRP